MGRFAVFIGVALGILAAIHYYLWVRLVRAPQLPAPWHGILTLLVVSLAASIPGVMFLGRGYPRLAHLLAWPAFTWMGVMFLLFVGLVSTDLMRLFVAVGRRALAPGVLDEARRAFVARLTAGAVALFGFSAAAAAVRSALSPVRVRKLRIPLDRLPRSHTGLGIVQLTDLHVGPTIGRAFIEDVVRRTNALSPDIVAITGDLVDGAVTQLREAIAPLADLRARYGVFFVTGNHEYFSDAVGWTHELTRIGIRVLQNERVTIGAGNEAFDLAGVDDPSAVRYGGLPAREAAARALGGRVPERELVLLAHQPRSFLDAEPFDVGLQLSGHTHAGQVWPFNYLVRLQQPFVAGLHRRGRSHIYVSSGTGYWGPPMRLGTTAEITHLTLVGPDDDATDAAPVR
jgi:predicted MPP superfamily phosphohydrolase